VIARIRVGIVEKQDAKERPLDEDGAVIAITSVQELRKGPFAFIFIMFLDLTV